ncbi:uncharacterized protein LOC114378344 [Glycine soja]|uniref:Uncharacterized protein n=1 Tax=Glycine soja TaxID=3848 RepID=A0A445HLB7_GLYSO|nr:uncharacterized protein LOC114378344 [Glycine soja]KHN25236.1 hypothetical protein glysoja_010153 [Glycine soja]RZB74491.1 hypothetical protein D0Y65_033488 [Glycine soja]
MAINSSIPFQHQFLHDERGEHILPPIPIPSRDPNHTNCNNNNNNISGHDLKPPELLIPVPNMPHFMPQDNTKFDSSSIGSDHLESLWDSVSSPQSTLSSTLISIQGSSEDSSQEPSPNSYDFCWNSTYDVVEMLEKMKLDERDSSKYNPGYGNHRLEISNVGACSLLHEQIQAIQLSRVRQEQILSEKHKLTAYRGKNHGQISQQFQKKVKGIDDGCDKGWRTRPPWHNRSHQQAGSRGKSCGTGVFLPCGRTSAPLESRKRPDKGCSTVLIPARVVQALQLHFEQRAATSGPKPGGFPPLHDVLVSNRDGMYSLQKRQSRYKPAHIQNEMILPQEWTY